MGVGGGGFALLGTWLLYSEYEKNKHIDEYLTKVQKYQAAYQSKIDANDVEGAQRISEFYEQLMHEEEQVINSEGAIEKLIGKLAKLGIIVFGGLISYSIVKYVMNRYPPNNYEPPTPPGQVVAANVPAGESAYRKLSRYLKGVLHAFAEVPEYMTQESWAGLPNWVILVLAAAAAILIAVSFGLWSPALAPIAAMAV